ncbi:DUF1349 domain-containing protein [Streptomyces sp. IB2014 016-6]|uniref:DUF1349 domain-containing protein n=1 Tax=Streptomyces sp. IB2014 016-6 TaxID=2517818 RepID=UPI0011C96F0C|nr:DUF1349 domain-containing protein [Streptomyces sp. IB2014 016-6]TXL85424.1 DUF1349 domain-containing protein [Streptomyces sp. IB2014 016-6]
MTRDQQLAAVPFELVSSEGSTWEIDSDAATVRTTAHPRSDIFVDPAEGVTADAQRLLNAATLLGRPPAGDFRFSARVSVGFSSTFDAGVLLLWIDERHWAKLCFEYSPQGRPMVVSVVNRGVADDANAFTVDGDSIHLRVSRVGHAIAYHASTDGTTWHMIRYFALDDPARRALIGFEAQSPTGEGCAVTFDQVRFTRDRLTDLRDGS